jgi:hypothetical protein
VKQDSFFVPKTDSEEKKLSDDIVLKMATFIAIMLLEQELTFRSTTVSGRSNSPTIQSGIAPPHGLALSSLRSIKKVSTPFSCAKISAAHAPDGPPPTTATLYFMHNDDEDAGTFATVFPTKEDGEKAVAEATMSENAATVNFMIFTTNTQVLFVLWIVLFFSSSIFVSQVSTMDLSKDFCEIEVDRKRLLFNLPYIIILFQRSKYILHS